MSEIWKPNVTVAAICERDGRFLLVEEETAAGLKLNQPAGHLEQGEAIADAVIRETLEETAHGFRPEYLVGIYSWRQPDRGTTYLRFAFAGSAISHDAERALDTGIARALWMSEQEIRMSAARHRSPLLLRCIDDYRAGRKFSLDLLAQVA